MDYFKLTSNIRDIFVFFSQEYHKMSLKDLQGWGWGRGWGGGMES